MYATATVVSSCRTWIHIRSSHLGPRRRLIRGRARRTFIRRQALSSRSREFNRLAAALLQVLVESTYVIGYFASRQIWIICEYLLNIHVYTLMDYSRLIWRKFARPL